MINNATIEGRLTKDPVLKEVNGKSVVNIIIACDSPNKTTDFIPVTLWAHQAVYCAKYAKKGYLVGIKGSIKTSTYDASDGSKRNDMRIVAANYNGFNIISKPKTNNENTSQSENSNYVSNNTQDNNNFNVSSNSDFSDNYEFNQNRNSDFVSGFEL